MKKYKGLWEWDYNDFVWAPKGLDNRGYGKICVMQGFIIVTPNQKYTYYQGDQI
jgi:hypothetical protein